jgi:protein gp37
MAGSAGLCASEASPEAAPQNKEETVSSVEERREKGLFWDRAWKIIEGCTKVMPYGPEKSGCLNCWSERETVMRANHPHPNIRDRALMVTAMSGDDGEPVPMDKFTGHIFCWEDNLDLPLRTKKPTVWAVWNDLYHEDVPDEFLGRAYAVMALCPQHTFLVLTKRAELMAKYWTTGNGIRNRTGIIDMAAFEADASKWKEANISSEWNGGFSNVWHGVTAENQQAADDRIPHLQRVPGKRFVNCEPMLSEIDLYRGGFSFLHHLRSPQGKKYPALDAVLVGGESGPNARPMNPQWARDLRDQCAAAGIPYFHKQNGEFASVSEVEGPGEHFTFSDGRTVRRVGKRKADRLLDGRTHDELPWDEATTR